MSTLYNGRKTSPAITTSTGSLYLIPLKVCKKTDIYRLRYLAYSKTKGGGFFGEGDFFVAGAYGGVFDY